MNPHASVRANSEFEETTLSISVMRIDSQFNSKTPSVVVRFQGLDVACATSRNWIWDANEGSTLTLQCDHYVRLNDLPMLGTGRVDSQ